MIAAGLLLDLKTTTKPGLALIDMLQLIGYVLLDFEDEFSLDAVALFNARYGHMASWQLQPLLDELAGRRVDLQAVRAEFRALLLERR